MCSSYSRCHTASDMEVSLGSRRNSQMKPKFPLKVPLKPMVLLSPESLAASLLL